MQIIRGDDYQSWVYANHDDLVAVDPWLTNKQVFPGFNWLLHRSASQESYLVKNNFKHYHIPTTYIESEGESVVNFKTLFKSLIEYFKLLKKYNC